MGNSHRSAAGLGRIISLYEYYIRGPATELNIKFNRVAMVLAAVALLEGLAIAVNVHPDPIEGFGGVKAINVMLVGLELAVVGAVVLFALWWSEQPRRGGIVDKVVAFLPLLGGAAILIEGLVVAYLAAPILITDVGSVRGSFISAFGAQLFLLGSGLVTVWMFRSRSSVGLLVSLSAFLALSSAGIWMASVADRMSWGGVGGFSPTTVFAAALIVVAVGLAGVVLHYMGDWKFLGRPVLGMEVRSWALLVLGILIAVAGAVVMGLAERVVIANLGSFMESAVMLVGLGVFILGLLTFVPITLFKKTAPQRRWATVQACLFALLLLPFAILV